MTIERRDHGKSHSYWNTDTNTRIPGVTTIIDVVLRKKAIENWSATATAEYAVDHWDELAALGPSARLKALNGARYAVKDAAANRGTQVHKLAERLAKGERISIPAGLEGYVESYVRFLDEFDVEPMTIEGLVWSEKHNYCGTLDLIAVLPGESEAFADIWLLDIKTNRSGIFGETAMQLAAYRHADYLVIDGALTNMTFVDFTGAVHVRPDGYSLVPVDATDEEFEQFLNAIPLVEFMNTSKTLVGDPIEPPSESRWQLTEVARDEVLF